jgi:M6 family metalloprotease-like protein
LIRSARLGSLFVLSVLSLPGPAHSEPARVVLSGRARSLPQPVSAPSVSPAPPVSRPLRPFPDDLYAPGAIRTEVRPVSQILASRASASLKGLARNAVPPRSTPTPPRTLRLAIFRVDFLRDGAGAKTTGNGTFDLRTGVSGIPVDPPPHNKAFIEAHAEALRRFYDVESYGSLNIVPTVFPEDPDSTYHLDDTAKYGPWEVSQNPDVAALAQTFVTDALQAVDRAGGVNFGAFDAFVIVHAGTDFQGDLNGDTPFDIPSFTLTLSESLAVNGGAARVGRALVLPETSSQDDRIAALNGVFAHEFGHILGLPDLYNIYNGVPQLGYWSLMDSGENLTVQVEDPVSGDVFYADGVFPTSFDPWSRLQIFPDAVRPVEVGETWRDTLDAVEANPTLPLVFIDGLEYFLVENRAQDLDGNGFPFVQQDSTTGVFLGPVDDPARPGTEGHLEYDAVLPGGGMLIWHIDDRLAVPGFVSGAVNFQTGERGVAIEEADGISDMGRFNYGTPYDPFFVGNNAVFGPGTIPGSEADDGAYSGITIQTTSKAVRRMDVSITRAIAVAGWPVFLADNVQVRTEPGPMTTGDRTGDGIPEVVFGAEGVKLTQPGRLRTVVALSLDLRDTLLVADSLTTKLRPGLTASDHFIPATGAPSQPVVGGTVAGGRVYLWNTDVPLPHDVLNGAGAVGAVTPPVIWQPGGAPGMVLSAGIGSFQVITASGAGAHIDSTQAAKIEAPVAGPTLVTDPADLGGTSAAVAYQNGTIEVYPLVAGGFRPPPVHVSSAPSYLLSGWVNPLGSAPSLVAVSTDSVVVFSPATGVRSAAWGLAHPAALPPALADLDQDGRSEIALVDTTGQVMVWNGDGSPALGWPKQTQKPVKDLKLLDLDADGAIDLLVLDAAGRFYGWSGRGRLLPTYPRALGIFDPISSAVESFATSGDSVSWVWVGIGRDLAADAPALTALRVGSGRRGTQGDWRYAGQAREGGWQQTFPAEATPVATQPVLEQPLLAYPNPARDWVELRFLLGAGETAALEVLDLSGNVIEDARLDRRGGFRTGENAVRWELASMAPGLYFCRLERSGGSQGSRVDVARVVVLR